MSNPITPPEVTLLSAATALTVSQAFNVSDYDVVSLNVFATSGAGANGTLRVYASNQEDAPTIGSPSASNMYFRVAIKDLGSETSYTPSSEFTLGASSTHNKGFNVNIDGARWLWVELASVTATVSVTVTASGRKI